jgi:hypothetical protein
MLFLRRTAARTVSMGNLNADFGERRRLYVMREGEKESK